MNVDAGRGVMPSPGLTRATGGDPGCTAGAVAITGAEVASDAGTWTRFAGIGRRLVIVVADTAVTAPGTPIFE
jgi:hypothetical protein